jgi:putative addiction module component (TIGR02574 family)
VTRSCLERYSASGYDEAQFQHEDQPMSVDAILKEIEALSAAEQAELLGRLSERFAPTDGAELSPELKAELERRVAEADANPGTGVPWEVVYAE